MSFWLDSTTILTVILQCFSEICFSEMPWDSSQLETVRLESEGRSKVEMLLSVNLAMSLSYPLKDLSFGACDLLKMKIFPWMQLLVKN